MIEHRADFPGVSRRTVRARPVCRPQRFRSAVVHHDIRHGRVYKIVRFIRDENETGRYVIGGPEYRVRDQSVDVNTKYYALAVRRGPKKKTKKLNFTRLTIPRGCGSTLGGARGVLLPNPAIFSFGSLTLKNVYCCDVVPRVLSSFY